MKRREFLKSSVTVAASWGIPGAVYAAGEGSSEKPLVKSYRQLGKTDIRMGDISFGAGKLPSASMILRAIDQGVNYFDTAPDYGNSEELIGEAMAKRKGADRKKITIVSKYCTPDPYPGHLPAGSPKSAYIAAVDGSLKRMKIDYLDGVFVHAIGEKNADLADEKRRLLDETMLAATQELKQAGKVRYLAVSSHGPNHMEELLIAAIRSGHFDWVMPAFNFMKFPQVPSLLREAAAKGVGVVAMKTLAGAKESGIQPGGAVFEHAAFKWVLSHPEVAGLVITIKTVDELNLYLQASGGRLNAADRQALDHYAALHHRDYCRTGCGACMESCPQGVEIASILRHQMYFADYGDEKRAMQGYAALTGAAGPCLDCVGESCNQACEHGLPVAAKLRQAHRDLSWTTG